MILYNTTSDVRNVNKVLNKVKDISNFKIKDNVDILNPVILLSDNVVLESNYAYIKKFNRYYFIESITVMTDGLKQVKLKIDVLQTYRQSILNLTTFIERQEFNYSPYVVDNELVTQCKREVRYQILGTLPTASGSYVALTVSGGSASGEENEQ